MSNLSISRSTLKEVLKNILNPDIDRTNQNIIIDHLLHELSSDSIDLLIYLKHIKYAFRLFNIGDYCMVPASYIDISKYNVDILEDLGIYHSNDWYYGKVTGDSSWRTEFNKSSAKLKVEVFVHDDDGKIIMQEVDVLHTQLEKCSRDFDKTPINYKEDAIT